MSTSSNLQILLEEQLRNYIVGDRRLVLAFSGGLDSCVLLHLLHSLIADEQLLAWHVHHGLLECADDMAGFAESRAGEYAIPFKISYLNLDRTQSNLESRARQARYTAFQRGLNASDVLLTAHHADDQAETLLLNLFRGSGSSGLRGIAEKRNLSGTVVLRPLLAVSREDLLNYARTHGITWFEDPSNQDDRFDRNYLRNRVIPVIRHRWPALLKSMIRVGQIQAETRQILDEVASADFEYCRLDVMRLSKSRLLEFSPARQKNTIRYWVELNRLAGLPAGRLESLVAQLQAQHQAHPLIQAQGYDIRIYDDQLFIVKPFDSGQIKPRYTVNQNHKLHIPPLGIEIDRGDILERLKLEDNNSKIEVAFRSQSVPERSQRHRLKRLFQKYRIPPWQRDYTPLVLVDGNLKDILILSSK